MITLRKARDRGYVDHGWLRTYHTFSFADYYDPEQMGFRTLRVLNEDRVSPGEGFPRHSHRDMEIVTVVLQGALKHGDSLGNGSIIRPGDVQRMSAGTGITHSEYNASDKELVHFLQIWILPNRRGLEPSYEQKTIPDAERLDRLRVVASPDGHEGSLAVHQDLVLYSSLLDPGQSVEHPLGANRYAWLQVARGSVRVNGMALDTSDGAAISAEPSLTLRAIDPAEILLFDLA